MKTIFKYSKKDNKAERFVVISCYIGIIGFAVVFTCFLVENIIGYLK